MTLDRIREYYETSYFCQVSKWGYSLTKEEAIELGLLQPSKEEPPKTPDKRTVTRKKVSEPTKKEAIE